MLKINMDLPNSCDMCIFEEMIGSFDYPDLCSYRCIISDIEIDDVDRYIGISDNCPLIEVKEGE